jgi:hypothetical protein
MATSMTVAEIIAANTAGTLTSVTPVSDRASQVDANFDALHAVANAGLLGPVSLTNGGRPTIAITAAQAIADAGVLGLINTPYFLAQRTTAAQAAGAVLAAPFKAIAIVDTAANIAANLPAIQAIYTTGYLGTVRMTDTGTPVFSLSAAQVAANADALHNISSPYSVTLTDAGTPTITLPVWDAATTVYTNVIAGITTPFNLAFNGVIRPSTVASIEIGVDHYTSSNVSGLPANPIAPLGNATAALLPGGLRVLDYQAKLSNDIDSLQIAAQAGKLASVTQRDGGVQVISLTPAQATNDALALSLFSANTQLSQIITAAQAGAPPPLDARFFNFTVQDSLANVLANISAIDAVARSGQMTKLRITETAPDIRITAAQLVQDAYALSFAYEESMTITLTDGGTPTVTISGDLLNSSNIRNNILNHITGPFNLVVTGVIDAFVATSIVSENNKVLASLTSVRVADFSTNIASNMAALQTLAAGNQLTAIDVVGGGVPTLGLSSATATADAQALAKISSPVIATNATSSPKSMTAAAFTAALTAPLPTLEQQALAGTLGAITLTDGGTPVLSTSAANLVANLEAYGKITSAYSISLTDGGVPALVLSHWQLTGTSISVLAKISGSFTLSISGALSAGQAIPLVNSVTVFPKVTGLVNITDYSNNLSNNNPSNLPALTSLSQAGHLGSITLFDGGNRFALTTAQASNNAAVLNAITSPYTLSEVVSAAAAASTTVPSNKFISLDVVDTVANVVTNLATLEPLAASGKITVLNFTGSSPFAMSISAATLGANADVLRLASLSNTFSIALTDVGTPTVTLQDWQITNNNNIPTLLSRITTPFTVAINGPIRTVTAAALDNFGAAFVAKIANNSLVIRDPALSFQLFTNSMPQLLDLANAGKIASIDLRTGGVPIFPITAADRTTYAPVFNRISTPYLQAQLITVAALPNPVLANGFTTFAVQDSVANVLGALPQLEALAAAGKLAELVFTDTVPRIVTSAANITSAPDVWAVEDNSAYPFVLTDPGTPVITIPSYDFSYAMRNDVLDAIVGPWSLQITGSATPATMAVIAEENNGVLAHLAGGIAVSDWSYNVQQYLDQLEFLTKSGKIGSINLIDDGVPTLTISAQQATADIDALNKITSPFQIGCFAEGTLIETETGPVAVEALATGDCVVTADGLIEPVAWVGSRAIDCRAHPRPETVWPARVAAGAFGPELPVRDLFLSPDHAVFVNHVLIPVKLLINGTSIVQVNWDRVRYFHVELPRHDVILAEGLPVESYLDTGDRAKFSGGAVISLYPDFAARTWQMRGCAPLVLTGLVLEAVRERLLKRASTCAIEVPSVGRVFSDRASSR